ncbi:MAG TPA: hypothetical protein VHR46_07800 [Gaiella sp.]|jgi:hypothetical protein|nr:hypothetical protein [Gaiella sp.]
MVWEVVFMLVLLKIPLVYLCMVVWWAIRAEPRDEHPTVAARVPDTPVSPPTPPGRLRDPRGGGDRRADDRRGRRQRDPARPQPTRTAVRS